MSGNENVTEERFIEIHMEEGFYRWEAENLWEGRPFDFEDTPEMEARMRRTARQVVPGRNRSWEL